MEQDNKKVHHLNIAKNDIGKYVFLPGDPKRCETIASYLDDAHFVMLNREHCTYTGSLEGQSVSVVSTGMGCPSAAIAIEELIELGAHTFIRIGTSGGMQPEINPGDLAIVTGAIRNEWTTRAYLPIEFPAVADIEVVNALKEAAENLQFPHWLGISQSKDSFFGQHDPHKMPIENELINQWRSYVRGGAICSEMESAAIFVISSIRNVRSAAIMLVCANQERYGFHRNEHDTTNAIKTAVEAFRILIKNDNKI